MGLRGLGFRVRLSLGLREGFKVFRGLGCWGLRVSGLKVYGSRLKGFVWSITWRIRGLSKLGYKYLNWSYK